MGKNKAIRQDSPAFPSAPSASIAGYTMQESVCKTSRGTRRLADDASSIPIVLIHNAGFSLPTTFNGEVQTRTVVAS